MSYLGKRKNAFIYAFEGLAAAFVRESHMRVHLVAALVAVGGGWFFSVQCFEWLIIAGCIALVMSLELINTAIEKICDLVQPEYHPTVKYVKDISSAAVVIACLFSIVAAIVIFSPYIRQLFT